MQHRKDWSLDAVISSGEGSYGSYNKGRAGDSRDEIDFAKMTVRELMRRQSLPRGDANRIFAWGKFQIIPETMRGAVLHLQIQPDTLATPDLQELIFYQYLLRVKRPKIYQYITGQCNTISTALLALSQEWASIASPQTGKSYYDGDSGGNSASISVDTIKKALEMARKRYMSAIYRGADHETAWGQAVYGNDDGENVTTTNVTTTSGENLTMIEHETPQPATAYIAESAPELPTGGGGWLTHVGMGVSGLIGLAAMFGFVPGITPEYGAGMIQTALGISGTRKAAPTLIKFALQTYMILRSKKP